jgi:hypothetical protein
MRSARYPVTTLGELGDAPPLEGELLEAKPKACCNACARPTIGALEDLAVLYNPIVWAAQKLIGAGLAHATDDDGSTKPGAIDQLARALGIDPVEVAIELTGYSGLGRYWPAMKVAGGAAAIGGAAYLAARAIKARRATTTKRRKAKRG